MSDEVSDELLRAELLSAIPGLSHGFSTRYGGVSEGPFASLNLKYPVNAQDEVGGDARVAENRRRLCTWLQLPFERLTAAQQTHGCRVQVVGEAEAGRGALSQQDGFEATDALISDSVGIPLLVMVADCLPVLMADPVSRGLGAVHSGWRGVQQAIVPATIAALKQHYGTLPENLRLVIGPGIGFASFEVGPEVVAAFDGAFALDDTAVVQPQGEKYRLNLPELVRRQALAAGVPDNQIAIVAADTLTDAHFFSYRRSGGVTGRQAGVIGWRE